MEINVGSVRDSALLIPASPILLAAYAKWIEPRFSMRQKPEADSVENSHPDVIIADFGRLGQIVGRLLYANDTVEESLKLVDLARVKFPHLKNFSRARNVQHMYDLI